MSDFKANDSLEIQDVIEEMNGLSMKATSLNYRNY